MENQRNTLVGSFDKTIIQAVDEALKELGESVSEAVFFQVERKYSIRKEDIPEKFGEFILAIRKEFGSGSKTIEALILEKLFSKTGQKDEFQSAAATMILLSSEFKQSMEDVPCR